MGNYIAVCPPSGEDRLGERVGTNGSGSILVAFLLAGYVIDSRPEMLRASNWIEANYSDPNVKDAPFIPSRTDGKRAVREAVKALVAYNYKNGDGAERTAMDLQAWTMLRGLKLKRPADPVLDDLGVMFERYYSTGVTIPLEPERVQRLAALAEAVLPHLKGSCWYEHVERCCAVLTYAAERGWPVRFG